MNERDLAKLSEAADQCGIRADVLKLMAADDLLPQLVSGRAGHVCFPRESTPTWNDCVKLLEEQRDGHLRRAAAMLRRLATELEAVDNDINEAREQPRQTLGGWCFSRGGPALIGAA